MILNVQPSLDRFDALDRQCHGQDQDAGKMVQRQCQEHRSVFFLFVGRQRRSDGCDMTSSVGQRSAKKLAGVDRGGFLGAVRTSLNALWEKNNVRAQLQMLEDEEYE